MRTINTSILIKYYYTAIGMQSIELPSIPQSTLIIDGEYFLITLNDAFGIVAPTVHFIQEFVYYMSVVTKAVIVKKYFFCGANSRNNFIYDTFKLAGFTVDTRQLKRTTEKCSHCHRKKFKNTEAEIDVAIGVRITLEALTNPYLRSIIVVGGDRDYVDGVKVAIERKIGTFLVGEKRSMSYRYKEMIGVSCILYLSYILKRCYEILNGFPNLMCKTIKIKKPVKEIPVDNIFNERSSGNEGSTYSDDS